MSDGKTEDKELLEKLAEFEHEQWSGWTVWQFDKSKINDDGTVTIPAGLAFRWFRQMKTPYKELSEGEKASDRVEGRKLIQFLNSIDYEIVKKQAS